MCACGSRLDAWVAWNSANEGIALKSPELLELELGAGDCKPKGVACWGLFLGGAKSRRVGLRMNPSGCATWNSGLRVNMLRVGKDGTGISGFDDGAGPKSELLVNSCGGVTGLVISASISEDWVSSSI